jgi:hypothetical protein
MPVLPAHLGPVILIGGLAGKKLNLTVLILATLLIDIDVVVLGIQRGMFIYHGFLHTLSGATIFGIILGSLVFMIFSFYWKGNDLYFRGNKSYRRLKNWRDHNWNNSYKCMLTSAIIGAYSHIALDWPLYEDIQISPVTEANLYQPLSDNFFSATISGLYLFCVICSLIGIFLFYYRWENNLNRWYKTSGLFDITLRKKDIWAVVGIVSTPFAIAGFASYTAGIIALAFNPDNVINPLNNLFKIGGIFIFSVFSFFIMTLAYSKALEINNWKLFE